MEEYIVQHSYTISPTRAPIEQARYLADEERQRYLRLYEAIVVNEPALQTVLEYVVMFHHDIIICGTNTAFLEGYYGEIPDFINILAQVAEYFLPEDRAWVLMMEECSDADQPGDGFIGEALYNCFEPASDWKIAVGVGHSSGKEEDNTPDQVPSSQTS